jgi:hypothetical protein
VKVTAEAARRFLVARHLARASVEVLGVWWEDGFAPDRADGFVDAMRDALRAYVRFAGAGRIEWAAHLGPEKRLFLTRP